MTFEKLQFVAERTLLGSGKEALFAVRLREEPRSLQRFCEETVNGYNITQFGYRLQNRDHANIFVGIDVSGKEAKRAFITRLKDQKYDFEDLSADDLAKEHVRHMIGGKAPNACHEHFYRIDFPERPGALSDFLQAVSNAWNISLFHYRGLGGDEGMVLIGFEAPNRSELEKALNRSGYSWERKDDATSLKIFIG